MKTTFTLKTLSKSKGKVYIYLANAQIGKKFLHDSELEGFTFGDGAKPTSKHYSDLFAINPDMTISYVTTNGRIAFGSGAKTIGNLPLIRIDYGGYM